MNDAITQMIGYATTMGQANRPVEWYEALGRTIDALAGQMTDTELDDAIVIVSPVFDALDDERRHRATA